MLRAIAVKLPCLNAQEELSEFERERRRFKVPCQSRIASECRLIARRRKCRIHSGSYRVFDHKYRSGILIPKQPLPSGFLVRILAVDLREINRRLALYAEYRRQIKRLGRSLKVVAKSANRWFGFPFRR